MKKIALFLVLLILVASPVAVNAAYDIAVISVPKVEQEESLWCWAACSVSVIDYFGTAPTQSQYVCYVKNKTTAVNAAANFSELIYGLSHWNLSGTYSSSYISYATVKGNCNTGKPIIAGLINNLSRVGHMVVVNGFDGANASTGYIEYMDPAMGEYQFMPYNTFKNGNWIWYETLYSIH